MKFYDVSKKIYPGMPVYKNIPDKQPQFTTVTNKYITETRVYMDVHSGTQDRKSVV
jgi:arylformamidase